MTSSNGNHRPTQERLYPAGKPASPQECNQNAGIITNAKRYGIKAVRSKPNKLFSDNLRELADIRDPKRKERIKSKYAKLKKR